LEETLQKGLKEGIIQPEEEGELRDFFRGEEGKALFRNFLIHVATNFIPVPFGGNVGRVVWTSFSRARAWWDFKRGKVDAERYHYLRELHSPLVIFIGILPTIGTYAYFFSRPADPVRRVASKLLRWLISQRWGRSG